MYTLILGFDAFDPKLFEQLSGQGRLPHLTRYAQAGGYRRFGVSNPPQSEVSWTSIATGLNPGGHGIFDFVHRDPTSYAMRVSLLPTERGLGGIQFVPPSKATTIFHQATHQGFPATALWWPATFPARPEFPVRTLPGLGTPDIQGRLGVGTLFTTRQVEANHGRKTPIVPLTRRGKGRYTGQLLGPIRKTRKGKVESAVELQLDDLGDGAMRLAIGKQIVDLQSDKWSPVLEIPFKVGRLFSVRALSRFVLTHLAPSLNGPDVELYTLPLQIHPMHSPWRYATPRSFVKRAWKEAGPFLTLGWPQDTTGLEEGCISDEHFLALCQSIFETRERLLMNQLQDFEEGLLASVFDSLDRIQHMFWRDRPDIVEEWYEKLDDLLGRIEGRLAALRDCQPRIIVVSDHGFSDFHYKVHLNRWLIERGYLAPNTSGASTDLKGVDWSRSLAYALGLNSLYLNLEGREGQGCVPVSLAQQTSQKLREELLAWQGPDTHPVVRQALRQQDAFAGPLSQYGPDIVVGYSAGYRASSETGLGKWAEEALAPNDDHWGADHCIDTEEVPGILFCNQGLADYPNVSYHDFPQLAIGTALDASHSAPPPSISDEETALVEERLRGLGYL